MLKVNVTKKLGGLTFDYTFEAPAKGVTALSGPSGSGKTTVINMIAGLVTPDSGVISLAGSPLFDGNGKVDVPVEKRRVGYVFQEALLFPHMSVRANLCYGLKRTPKGQRRVSLPGIVELLGVSHLLERRPGTLSGGEKQRVAIGRALLTSPALLVMDEPLASLDQARKDEVLPFIKAVSTDLNIPIVYVSHSPEEINALTDRVVFVESGRNVTRQRLRMAV